MKVSKCFICFVILRSSLRILRPYALPRDHTEVYDVSNFFFYLFCVSVKQEKIEFRVTFGVLDLL